MFIFIKFYKIPEIYGDEKRKMAHNMRSMYVCLLTKILLNFVKCKSNKLYLKAGFAVFQNSFDCLIDFILSDFEL